MKLELKLFEVETLIFVLSEKIHYREINNLSLGDLAHIKKMIEIQMEEYKDDLVEELERQYCEEGELSVCSLQQREGLGYSRASKFIEEAKANVKYRRLIAAHRKEQQ